MGIKGTWSKEALVYCLISVAFRKSGLLLALGEQIWFFLSCLRYNQLLFSVESNTRSPGTQWAAQAKKPECIKGITCPGRVNVEVAIEALCAVSLALVTRCELVSMT